MNIDTTLYMACQDIKELVYIRKSTTVALPLRLIPEAITHPIPAYRALSLSLFLFLASGPHRSPLRAVRARCSNDAEDCKQITISAVSPSFDH